MVSTGDNGGLSLDFLIAACYTLQCKPLYDTKRSQLLAPRGSTLTLLDPIPSLASLDPTSCTRLICDERAITSLLEHLSDKSGLSVTEIARRMGLKRETVRAYVKGKRANPPLQWFLKFVSICGGVVDIKRA